MNRPPISASAADISTLLKTIHIDCILSFNITGSAGFGRISRKEWPPNMERFSDSVRCDMLT